MGLKVLTGAGASIDRTKPEGQLFAALAEYERELIRERTKAGMSAARRRGRHAGRPRKPRPDQRDMASDRLQRNVAKALGIRAPALREAMKQRAA